MLIHKREQGDERLDQTTGQTVPKSAQGLSQTPTMSSGFSSASEVVNKKGDIVTELLNHPTASQGAVNTLRENFTGKTNARIVLLRHLLRKPYSVEATEKRYADLNTTYMQSGTSALSSDELIEYNKLDDESDVYTFDEIKAMSHLSKNPEEISKLSEKEKKIMKECQVLLKLFDNLFSTPNSTVEIWYDSKDAKRRNAITMQQIEEKYRIREANGRVRLPGADKGVIRVERREKNLREIKEVRNMIDDDLGESDPTKEKTIILLGNSTYAEHFLGSSDYPIDVTMTQSVKMFRDQAYLNLDMKRIHSVEGETRYTTFKHEPTTVLIHLHYTIQEAISELRKAHSGLLAEVDISKMSHLQLQNRLNAEIATFDPEKKQDFFKKLMTSKHEEFRVCAMANLLKNNIEETITLLTHLYLGNQVLFSLAEEDLLLKNITNQDVRELYRTLSKSGYAKRITHRDTIEAYNELRLLQENSLDEKIRNHETGALLKRKITWTEIQKNTEIADGKEQEKIVDGKKQEKITKVAHDIDFNDIIEKKFPSNTIVLPAHVGTGKTMWLTDFTFHVINQHPDKIVTFIKGSDIEGSRAPQVFNNLRRIIADTSGNHVICIDAIDEVSSEYKDELKSIIATNVHHKFVITSRPSEYDEKENEGMVTLCMEPVSKDVYLKSRISDETIRNKIEEKLRASNLAQEVEGNPLLLNFICILAREEGDSELQDLRKTSGVKSLDEICNKADLYENIAKLIIIQHNYKKGDCLGKLIIEKGLNNLGEWAYLLFTNQADQIDFNDDYFQFLSLFFKKSNNSGENDNQKEDKKDNKYKFIHESFREYFFARHLALHPEMQQSSKQLQQPSQLGDEKLEELLYPGFDKGAEEIFQVRDANFENWNEWRNFKPTVLFYGQILGNIVAEGSRTKDTKIQKQAEECLKKLEKFLGEDGALKKDDIYGECFFVGLEIIESISLNLDASQNAIIEGITKHYVTKAGSWNTAEILHKLHLFQDGYLNRSIHMQVLGKSLIEMIKVVEFSLNRYKYSQALDFINALITTKDEEVLSLVPNWIGEFIKYYRNWDTLYLIKSLIIVRNKEVIKLVPNWIKQIINEGDLDKATFLINAMISLGDTEIKKHIFLWVKEMFDEDKPKEAIVLMKLLFPTENKEIIKLASNGVQILLNMHCYDEVSEIAEILIATGDKEIIKLALSGIKESRNTKYDYEISSLIENLIATGDKEVRKKILTGMQQSFKEGRLEEVIDSLKLLIPAGDKEAKKLALMWANQMFHERKYKEVIFFMKPLILIRDEKSKKLVLGWISLLPSEYVYYAASLLIDDVLATGDEEMNKLALSWTQKFLDKHDYYKVSQSIETLLSTGGEEMKALILVWANRMFHERRYKEAFTLIKPLVTIGYEAIKSLSPNWAKQMFHERMYKETLGILKVMLSTGGEEMKALILVWAKQLFNIGKPQESISFIEFLFPTNDEEMKVLILVWAKQMFNECKYKEAIALTNFLVPTGDEEVKKMILGFANTIFYNGDYSEAFTLAKFLIRIDTEEAKKMILRWIKILNREHEYKQILAIVNIFKASNYRISEF